VSTMLDIKSVEETVDDIVTSCGFSLVELKLGGTPNRPILRVFIHRREGVGIDDCAKISRELETVLEEKTVFTSKYVLEVSSPGLERVLSRPEEFGIFMGSRVKVEVGGETDGTRAFIGTITGFSETEVKLEVVGGGEVSVSLGNIRKARLHVDWNRVSKGNPNEF